MNTRFNVIDDNLTIVVYATSRGAATHGNTNSGVTAR